MDNEEVEIYYEKHHKAFERSLAKICMDFDEILTDYSVDRKIRYKKPFEKRIKTLDSIILKLKRKNLKDIFDINDLVGIRILVFNKIDADNIKDLIIEKWSDRQIKVENYTDSPKDSGYRGIHLNFINIVNIKDESVGVPIELQIKTLSQDLWSVLSHEDLYKQECSAPDIINQFSSSLGALLEIVDNQGQYIREFITKKILVSKDITFDPHDEVDREILANIIKEKYDYDISEENYRIIIKYLELYNILTVDLFRKLINEKVISESIDELYKDLYLGKPDPVDYIMHASMIYLRYLSEGFIDTDYLRENIIENYDLTDNQCQDCGKYLTSSDESFCCDHVENANYVCADCLDGYEDCCRCGNKTNNEMFCDNCLDHMMDDKD